MSNNAIKRIDISQIRYKPQDGEIVINTVDDGYYIYKDGNWMKINVENSGLNLGLYDLNKQIIAQLPILSDEELSRKKAILEKLKAVKTETTKLLKDVESSINSPKKLTLIWSPIISSTSPKNNLPLSSKTKFMLSKSSLEIFSILTIA